MPPVFGFSGSLPHFVLHVFTNSFMTNTDIGHMQAAALSSCHSLL
jgi:hypothetical protein